VATTAGPDCGFCAILSGGVPTQIVLDDENTFAFLDNRPLFPGHSLLVPREHIETLADVPDRLLGELFGNARLLSRAMETGLGAQGSFVAINNVVPRTKGDGLRGFFWPRHKYEDEAHAERVAEQVRDAVASLRKSQADA
jgi:histidine triad (HIT) family protein